MPTATHPIRRLVAFAPPPAIARAPGENVRLFLLTFVSGFLAFSALIA